MGKSKESFVMAAQAKSKNAWEASQQAALLAFKSALAADQVLFDAKKIRTSFFCRKNVFDVFASLPVYWEAS